MERASQPAADVENRHRAGVYRILYLNAAQLHTVHEPIRSRSLRRCIRVNAVEAWISSSLRRREFHVAMVAGNPQRHIRDVVKSRRAQSRRRRAPVSAHGERGRRREIERRGTVQEFHGCRLLVCARATSETQVGAQTVRVAESFVTVRTAV